MRYLRRSMNPIRTLPPHCKRGMEHALEQLGPPMLRSGWAEPPAGTDVAASSCDQVLHGDIVLRSGTTVP